VWQNWEQLPHANTELCQEWLRKVLLPRWLALCAHAVQHADVQSLIFWSAPDQRAEPMLQMLGEFYASRMQQAAAIAQSVLQASESVLSTPAARELVHFFRTGRWREAQCKVSLSVALAIDETHAAPMTLHLEQVDENAPYPHPATMWFVSEDAAFRESVAQANVPPLPLAFGAIAT
jgi:hypothetical protein